MKPYEEELLLRSYVFSANRVLEGLRGNLPVRNSRDGSPPSVPQGMIVGLCGQGGRHVFFDIPVVDVELALMGIENLIQSRTGNSSLLGGLQAICSSLRQSANFYPDSGCVNDSAPRLVPWMPPEEIWTEHGELPLDLWRLLCFDIDFLSTTLSAALDSADLSYTSLSQAALAFASLIRRAGNRPIEFDLVEGTMPPSLSVGSRTFRCPLMRLFMEAGSLLTPLSRNDDFSRWFLAFRYFDWLSSSTLLRVKQTFRDSKVDSRYKGIFSEEMAIAMMAVVMQDRYNAVRINNTAEIIKKPPKEPVADFIIHSFDPQLNPVCLALECKGSLGNAVSSSRMLRAKDQVRKTRVPWASATVGVVCRGLIFYENQTRRSMLMVDDPPLESDAEEIEIEEVLAWRVAYAKFLRFVGLERASQEVYSGEPAVSLPRFVDQDRRRDEGGERRSMRRVRLRRLREEFRSESILDLGFGSVVVDSLVHKILQSGISQENVSLLTGHLAGEARAIRSRVREGAPEGSFLSSLGTGFVSYEG